MNRNRPLTILRFHSAIAPVVFFAALATTLAAQTANPPFVPAGDTPPPAAGDSTVVLSPFTVTGAGTAGYGAAGAASSSRLNVAYIDIPQSVTVITNELLEDTHTTESHDFVMYVNNVYPRANDHQPELFFIHGLQVTRSWVDGFLSALPVNRDSALYDRIDYVKGPASASMGRGDAGGMVNYVVKRPTGTTRDSVSVTVGDFDYFRVEADDTRAITSNGKMSYRLPLYYESENSPTGGNLMHIKKYGMGPSFLWQIAPKTQLFISTAAFIYNGPGVVGERYWSNPNVYRMQVSLAQVNPNNPANWNPFFDPNNPGGRGDAYIPKNVIFGFPGRGRHDSVGEVSAVVVQTFTDWLSYRQGFHADDLHEYYQRYSLGVAAVRSPVDPTDFLVGITDLNSHNSNNSVRAQGDLLASHDFTNGSLWTDSSHQLLFGYDLFSNRVGSFSAQQGGLAQSLYHPNYATPLSAATGLPLTTFNDATFVPYTANTANSEAHGNGRGFYGQYSGWFFKHSVGIMYGLRNDISQSTTYNYRTHPTTVTQTGRQNTTVPRYSITYKPTQDISIYYLHSEQADPAVTTALYSNFSPSGGATAPPPTDPLYDLKITAQVKAKFDEFGSKVQLLNDQITGSIAFFQSYRSGFILNQTLTQVGYNGIGSVLYNTNYVVNGEVVHGMEAEITGRPVPRLSFTAGCAFQNGYRPGPAAAPTVAGQIGNSQLAPIESLIDTLQLLAKYDLRDENRNGLEVVAGGKYFFKDWIMSPGTTVMFDANQYLVDAGVNYYFCHGRYYVNAMVKNVTNQLVYISQNSQWSLRRSYVAFGTKF
jgi:outer membrane receptor protein involved in Fe transport